MIVFVNEDELDEAINFYPKVRLIAISGDKEFIADKIDASWAVPPPDILIPYLNEGNKDKFREGYYRYLSDPRVAYLIYLTLIKSDEKVTFFCYKDMEYDLHYPKFLRKFVIEHLEISKKFVVKYEDFTGKNKHMSDKDICNLIKRAEELRKKVKEIDSVLS